MEQADDSDFLYGIPAIAKYLGIKVRATYHLHENAGLPTFRLAGSGKICARKSTLKMWLAEQEGKALARGHEAGGPSDD